MTKPWKVWVNKMNERVGLYSMSLYSAACEEGCAKEVYDSLKVIEEVLKDNGEYIKIASSALISAEEREGLVDEAFSGRVNILSLNFMKILAKKRIFDILVPCIGEYEKQYLKDNNITNATITTAFELDEKRKEAIINKIGKATGKTVIGEFVVKKDIVGGIIIETENSSVDASVTGKLQSIERYISKN